MPKNMNVNNTLPIDKTSTSVGTRGDSTIARNKSGNHHGNRGRAQQRGRTTRQPKTM